MAVPAEDAEAARALQTLDEDEDVTDEEELQLLEPAEVSRVRSGRAKSREGYTCAHDKEFCFSQSCYSSTIHKLLTPEVEHSSYILILRCRARAPKLTFAGTKL